MLNDQSDIQMSRFLPYLQYLPAFEATARLGGVRQAAEELNLSPSAISLQLKKLSDATGIILFRKSGRNVALTQAGRDFRKPSPYPWGSWIPQHGHRGV